VYVCAVCERRFDSRQALAGHMRWHPAGSYVHTSFDMPTDLAADFKRLCDKHGTTYCAVLRGFARAWVAGEKDGVVTVPSQNPVTIQYVDVRLGSPRGRYSHLAAAAVARAAVEFPRVLCNFYGGISPGEVYCRNRCYAWLPWERCAECEHNRAEK